MSHQLSQYYSPLGYDNVLLDKYHFEGSSPSRQKQTSATNHTMHMATSQTNCTFSNTTIITVNLPLLPHNLHLSQLSSHLPWRWRNFQNISGQTTVCQSKMHHCGITHPAHSPLCLCRCVNVRHFSRNDLVHTSQPSGRSPLCRGWCFIRLLQWLNAFLHTSHV